MAKIRENKKRPHKMRFVLLERPSPEQNVKPEWYKKLVDGRPRLENCFWQKQFYEMKPMERKALFDLMDNIAGQKNKTLTEQNKQAIYERVCSFHQQEEGGSPLYIIQTTDSFLNDNNDTPLTSLDTNKLMESEEQCARDKQIALVYAKGLANLTTTQDVIVVAESVERLRKLAEEQYAEDKEIALRYATGLYDLSYVQELSDSATSVECLGGLSAKYVKNQQIALRYAWGLVMLTAKQDAIDGSKSVECLKRLSEEQYAGDKEIALWYAQGLVMLTAKQDAIAGAESVEQLRKLAEEQYAGNKEITLEYANGLVNLIAEQDAIVGAESVERLRKLAEERYAGNKEIALTYAKGLAWLCINEYSEDTVIQECQEFYSNWQTNPEEVKQAVRAEPDSNMKTLKLFLLAHTDLFPEFMEWLVS